MDHSDHEHHAQNMANINEMPGMTTEHHHMMTDDGMGMDMDMMKMYFHFSTEETILFYGWKTTEVWELILSMVAIFAIAFCYEALKYLREHLFRQVISKSQYASTDRSNISIAENNKPVRYMEQIIMPPALNMLSLAHASQTLLHMLQFLISYCLMLIFMTYNVWLCLAVLLGSGVGYFVFGWRKSVVMDITEHCH